MFTTSEPGLDVQVRDQRERLAGLVQARRTKFRVPRRRPLTASVQAKKPTPVEA